MKGPGRRYDEDFPATVLYLEDLRDILGAISSVFVTVDIRTKDYKLTDLESLDEFAARYTKGTFPDIYVRVHEPYFAFNIEGSGISVYYEQCELEQEALVAKIKMIVQR